MTDLTTARKPSAIFLAIADLLDDTDNWTDSQASSVDNAIDNCDKLAALCDDRGYTTVKCARKS